MGPRIRGLIKIILSSGRLSDSDLILLDSAGLFIRPHRRINIDIVEYKSAGAEDGVPSSARYSAE